MSSHDPKTSAEGGGRDSHNPVDADHAAEHPRTEAGPGVKQDPALRNTDRLPRLGNEDEKPADDRFGE